MKSKSEKNWDTKNNNCNLKFSVFLLQLLVKIGISQYFSVTQKKTSMIFKNKYEKLLIEANKMWLKGVTVNCVDNLIGFDGSFHGNLRDFNCFFNGDSV